MRSRSAYATQVRNPVHDYFHQTKIPPKPHIPRPKLTLGSTVFHPPWFVFHPYASYNRRAMENLTHTHETTPQTAPAKPRAPRSAAQIAASRANGAKSKGPVTEEGKANAARNSYRHGLLADLTVMETERAEAFIKLSSYLYENFEPVDEHERNTVDTMIIAMWRRTRALGMETAGLSVIIKKELTRPVAHPGPAVPGLVVEIDTHTLAFNALINNPNERHVLDLLHRYEVRHTRAYDRALKSLLAYRKENQTNPSPIPDETPEAAPENAPDPATTPDPEPKPVPNEPKPDQPQPDQPEPAPHSAIANTLSNRSPRWHRRQARLAKQRSKK